MRSDLLLGNDVSLQAHLALGFHEVERLIALARSYRWAGGYRRAYPPPPPLCRLQS